MVDKHGAQSVDLHLAHIWIHVGAGLICLAVGAVPLLARKGGPLHRYAGRAFVAIGAVVLSSSLVGIVFFDAPSPLVAAALAAGYQYLSSLRALRLSGRGPQLLDAALALAGLGGVAALFVFMGPGTASWTPALGYSLIGVVAIVAIYDLSRHFWARAWLKHARPLDHGLKMAGAYFGMMSAGVGNLFREWQPLSQFGPSVLGVVVLIVLVITHTRRRRQPLMAP